MKLPYDLVVFDLEASGESYNRITEIGAVRVTKKFEMAETFTTLVDGRPITPRVAGIVPITNKMLEEAPGFLEAGSMFFDWCRGVSKGFILASWSASFDFSLLREEYKRLDMDYPFHGKGIDLKSIAYMNFWQRGIDIRTCGVKKTLERLGLSFDGTAHRALDDAKMEAKIFLRLSEMQFQKTSFPQDKRR